MIAHAGRDVREENNMLMVGMKIHVGATENS